MGIQYNNNKKNVNLLGQAYVNREFSLLLSQGSITRSIDHESREQFLFGEDTAFFRSYTEKEQVNY